MSENKLTSNAYLVIPDSARLDIGENNPVAVFKYKTHAESFAKSMWEKYYIIEEIELDLFTKNN